MIDLHFHILPGIDDGPADMDASVALARAAARDGTHTIAATPHLREDHPAVRPVDIDHHTRRVNAQLAFEGVDVTVVAGGEADSVWSLNASAEDLGLVTYGQRGTDLLLETPYGEIPDFFEDLVFRLSVDGLRVLLAHPERSDGFQRDPERLFAIARRGVPLQVTTTSLLSGRRGSRSRPLAEALIERGLAQVLASDAHTTEPWRPPNLRAGVAALARIAPARAEWMVTDAPAAILAGAPIPPAPQERSGGPRRAILSRFRSGG